MSDSVSVEQIADAMYQMVKDYHGKKNVKAIADYVLHPIRHLEGGHMHHAGMPPMQHGPAMYANPTMRRRIIFLEIHGTRALTARADDFGINNQRLPRFYADVHLHTNEVLQVQGTPAGTGWGTVPTPMF